MKLSLLLFLALPALASDSDIYQCGRIQGALDIVSSLPNSSSDVVALLKMASANNCENVRGSIGLEGLASMEGSVEPKSKEEPKSAPKSEPKPTHSANEGTKI